MDRSETSMFETIVRDGAPLGAELGGGERRIERKALRHAERRREILDSARQLLVREGIERFTIGAVARAAGVSKPAVYYYFESKEEVVAGLAEEALRAEADAVEQALLQAEDAAGALSLAIRAYVNHYLSDPEGFRIVRLWRGSAQPSRVETDRTLASIAGRLAGCPVDAEGTARVALLAASGIVGAVLGGVAPRDEAATLSDAACTVFARALG